MPFWRRSKQTTVDPDRQRREEIAPRVKAARGERQRRLVGQEDRVAKLERLLFEHDPIGINFEENDDEYRSEAETITLRLPEASTEAELLRIPMRSLCGGSASPLRDPRLATNGSPLKSGSCFMSHQLLNESRLQVSSRFPSPPDVKQPSQRFWSVATSVGADRNLSRIASATFTRNSEVSLI